MDTHCQYSTDCQIDSVLRRCFSISTTDLPTILKACTQICTLSKKHTFTSKESQDICRWLIKLLHTQDVTSASEILNTMYCVLKNNNPYSNQLYDEMIGASGILWNLLENQQSEILLCSIKCLYVMLCVDDTQIKTLIPLCCLHKSITVTLKCLYMKKPKKQSELIYCEINTIAFKILTQIFSLNNEVDRHLNDTIGACKYWMLYLLSANVGDLPSKAVPSQQTVAEIFDNQSKKGGKKTKIRKPRNIKPVNVSDDMIEENNVDFLVFKPNYPYAPVLIDEIRKNTNIPVLTSDSDFSDSENSLQNKINAMQSKLRLSALNLLSIIVKTTSKPVIFNYWWNILPDNILHAESENRGLFLCIQKEPSVTGRMAAFVALLSFITASRPYLMQADTSKHMTLSFTPFSVALGISIEQIHNLLYIQLNKEHSIPLLVTILKCTAAIVQATPYNKLSVDCLVPIIECVRKFLTHKDWTIQVASLIVMGCIITINPPMNELLDNLYDNINVLTASTSDMNINPHALLNPSNMNSKQIDANRNANNLPHEKSQISWLVEICINNLGWAYNEGNLKLSNSMTISTRLESLQVLSAISSQYFDRLLAPFMNIIEKILLSSLADSSSEICLHAAKCTSSIGDAIQKSMQTGAAEHSENYLLFWTNLLHGSLTNLLQGDSHTQARAAACDCIGSMGETIFSKLEEKLRILAATLLLGCSGDEDPLVCSAAVRALAVCIMYQQWREDVCLVSDCIETTLRVINETSPSARAKAMWGLANITDALLLNQENCDIEMIHDSLIFRILNTVVTLPNENDKIKMNTMRAIGNIIYILREEHFKSNSQLKNTVKTAIDRLKQCSKAGNMKVRWNACHALGKALKNSHLYAHMNLWQESILEHLCELIQSCTNLKVCIHASAALRSPVTRLYYGSKFAEIWDSVMKALCDVNHNEDFHEYVHKNLLIEQLCVTLSHMASLITCEDLIDIFNPLCFYWEAVAQLIQQVAEKSEPQGNTCQALLDAAKYITTELCPNSEKEKQSLTILQNMFIWDY